LLVLVIGEGVGGGHLMTGYPALLQGIDACTRENGLKLLLSGLDLSGSLPAALDPNEVDGVLLFGKSPALSASARARLRDVPTVALMRGFEEFRGDFDRVLFDNERVGPLAAEYLIGRGHKRVGFFNIDPSHQAFDPRWRGFTETASGAGLEVISLAAERTPHGYREETAVYRALSERLWEPSQRVMGVFVAADYQVPQLYQALDAMGVSPGRDVEIISCDNVPFFLDRLSPRPATVDINLELVGYRGVQQLLWRMANTEVKNRIKLMIEPVLVPGN
jgi:LacI family transcriptional regulator